MFHNCSYLPNGRTANLCLITVHKNIPGRSARDKLNLPKPYYCPLLQCQRFLMTLHCGKLGPALKCSSDIRTKTWGNPTFSPREHTIKRKEKTLQVGLTLKIQQSLWRNSYMEVADLFQFKSVQKIEKSSFLSRFENLDVRSEITDSIQNHLICPVSENICIEAE